MAIGAKVECSPISEAGVLKHYPSGFQSDWVTCCDEPETVEADSGVVVGGKVVKPGNITRAAQHWIGVGSIGSKLLVAHRRNVDATTLTSPVVRIFGRDRNGVVHALRASDGSTELTITLSATLDAIDATGYLVSQPVIVSLDGSVEAIVTVQTAFNATGGTETDSTLIAKVVGDN